MTNLPKYMHLATLSISAIFILLINGCGTIFGGLSQDVKLTSDPPDVLVVDTVTGLKYTTPSTISLAKNSEHSLVFSKDGYRNEVVPLWREARFLWWFLDAFTLGIANGIDAATGGLFDIKPDQIHVALNSATK